jgi:hypothetical protein
MLVASHPRRQTVVSNVWFMQTRGGGNDKMK